MRYKIESTYFQFPIYIKTESADEAYEMFIAYCDYQGIDESDIKAKHDNSGVIEAHALQYSEDEWDEENDVPVVNAEFTFTKEV